MRRLLIGVSLLISGVLIGYFLTLENPFYSDGDQRENADVVLEKIKEVLKVVTVEGKFSEIYTYGDVHDFLMVYPAQKKAIVRVNATVMVGYDMDGVRIDTDEEKRTIFIHNIPEPQILSLEKSLDYYDITESTFNQFNEKDFSRIDRRTSSNIKKKVSESKLYPAAEQQLRSLIETLQSLVSDYGWKVKIEKDLYEDPFGGALDEK